MPGSPIADTTEGVEINDADFGYKYELPQAGAAELERRFTYHAPKADQPLRYNLIRADFHHMAENLVRRVPQSRELAVALSKLEEAAFYANAAIARNE